MSPKISIITVVYNDAKHISKTIESVINQCYQNIEYVIIDGGSKDSTVDKINNYINKVNIFISEQDLGIYDAMNKGTRLATGDFLLFLNSGDVFHNNGVISKLAEYIIKVKPVDLIYGDVGIATSKINFIPILKSKQISLIIEGMVANHQSCLISRDLQTKYNYDLKYKLASDYHFILRSYLNGARIVQIDEIISVISDGGVSDANRLSVFREKLRIKNELNYSLKNYFDFYIESGYMYIASMGKKILPNAVLTILYKRKYEN
ncbi:glycosyltransferase family 2 protein [Flavobacterium sp. TAB 87]|uniref:glycosyltransferase family 2 protein n=1 Tax=Flavobacterium sp. TAB 87 TaxID=1729581 RepID=UPI00076C336E|nr:glycosyltransferase family 2 protein [Flavobacterium sp. TAB 87]KVV13971.1 PGL/p-HBAD biosynthesis glycosyltransferase/MT3031 [Flavobacterium sp. TAB 87]